MIPLRQVSEGLAALESERDRTDRKFEALTEAGDGDAKSSLACCC